MSADVRQPVEINSPAASVSSNTNISLPDLNTAMIEAVQKGDVTTLQKLLDQGADPKALDNDKRTLLFYAGSPEVAELLIAKGVDLKAKDAGGADPLITFCGSDQKNAADIVRVLLKNGADPNVRFDGETPLMFAHDGKIVDLLADYGADLKAVDHDGYNVLFRSAQRSFSQFQALFRHGISFDAKADGPTLLLQASWVNNVPMVQWLLDHGVDPNTAGIWATINGKPDMMLPMQAAAVSGQTEAAKLLLSHGAKADDQIITALHNGNNKVVRLFWESGVRNISELCYAISQGAPVTDLQNCWMRACPPIRHRTKSSPLWEKPPGSAT